MKTHRFLLVGFAALLYYTAATLYLTPDLVRANLVQAAVLFSGTLDIRIVDTFGPWGRAHRRMRDIEECRRLGMAETGEVAYPDYFLPYRRKGTR